MDSKTLLLRQASAKKWFNMLDPIYLILDRIVAKRLFEPQKQKEVVNIPASDEAMLLDNLLKHRWIAWVNVGLALFMYYTGLDYILNNSAFDVSIVVTGLLAPAMITGTAWFAVSFGGIPSTYLESALLITSAMFLSFSLSMTLLTAILVAIVHWSIGILVVIPIYLALYVACVLYDNTDGLKIGLDETQLKYSRAMLNYHRKRGFISEIETQKLYFNNDDVADLTKVKERDDYVSSITERVKAHASQLEEKKDVELANDLIAESLFELFKVGIQNAEDRERVKMFNTGAFKLKQEDVDQESIALLQIFVQALAANGEIAQISIQRISEDIAKLTILLNDRGNDQHLIDNQFARIFDNIVTLIEQNKFALMKHLPDSLFAGLPKTDG